MTNIIVWTCSRCNWVSVSNSDYRHTMDICKCTERPLGVDLEESYCRWSGVGHIILARYNGKKWIRSRR